MERLARPSTSGAIDTGLSGMLAVAAVTALVIVATAAAFLAFGTDDPISGRPVVTSLAQTAGATTDLVIAHSTRSSGGGQLDIIDVARGQSLGSVRTAYSAMAVLRPTASQLIVSDIVFDSADGQGMPHPRLFIVDMRSGSLADSQSIALPGRVQYTLYAPAIALSSDERTLFYLQRYDCGGGCDSWSVARVDLDRKLALGVSQLPQNCGYAYMQPHGTGVAVLCPQHQSLWTVDGSGAVQEFLAFGPLTGGAWPVYGSITSAGNALLVTQDGRLVVAAPDGTILRDESLLASGRLSGVHRWTGVNGTVILGIVGLETQMRGAMFVSESGSVRTVGLPSGTITLAVIGGDRFVNVGISPAAVWNVYSGQSLALTALPPNVDWAIGERQ